MRSATPVGPLRSGPTAPSARPQRMRINFSMLPPSCYSSKAQDSRCFSRPAPSWPAVWWLSKPAGLPRAWRASSPSTRPPLASRLDPPWPDGPASPAASPAHVCCSCMYGAKCKYGAGQGLTSAGRCSCTASWGAQALSACVLTLHADVQST